MITPKVITAPTIEPVSVTEAKLQCRVELTQTVEDPLFDIYIAAARDYYEWRTGRTLHETEYDYVLHYWPSCGYIELPRATPLVSITHIKYRDSSNVEQTWSASEYIADTDNEPGRVVLADGYDWPTLGDYPSNPIRIRYKAGIAAASPFTDASAADKIPILLLVSAMYDNRKAVEIPDRNGVEQISVQYGVEAFISKRTVEYVF
jgi:uncharacterized phiE125 gp8 family phage protein